LTRPVRVLSLALADVAKARDWYDAQRPGLGAEFIEEFDRALKRIAADPEIFQKVVRDARRARLQRFPYAVYYYVEPNEAIVVAALHLRRDPKLLARRATRGPAP
jgi:plasmid stabilization system protein ParE